MHEIFNEDSQWATEQMFKFWWRSGYRIRIATVVRRTLAEVRTVPVHLSYCDCVVTFRESRRRREMYCGQARLRVSVCLSVRGRMTTLLHGPRCNLEQW